MKAYLCVHRVDIDVSKINVPPVSQFLVDTGLNPEVFDADPMMSTTTTNIHI